MLVAETKKSGKYPGIEHVLAVPHIRNMRLSPCKIVNCNRIDGLYFTVTFSHVKLKHPRITILIPIFYGVV